MKNIFLFIILVFLFNSCSIWLGIDSFADKIEFEREVMYNTKYVTVDSIQKRKWDNLIYISGYSTEFYYQFSDTLIYFVNDIIEFTDEIYSKSIMKRVKN
jgi:hypothetical protein